MRRACGVILSIVVLAGCGGGGGGGSSVAPPPPPNTAPIQSQSVQRAVASQALSVPSAAGVAYSFGLAGTASVARQVQASARRITAGWRASATHQVTPLGLRAASVAFSACSSGYESAIVTVSATEEQLYARAFYDNACTKLYQDVFLDLVATSSTAAQASGTITTYSPAGQVSDYATLTLSIAVTGATTGTFSMKATDAPNATAPQSAAVGIACNVLSASAVGCGFGALDHATSIGQDLGATLSFNANESTSNGLVTVSLSGNGAAYSGAVNALGLNPGGFPNWTITGGSTIDLATFSGGVMFTGSGALAGASFTLSDAASDATVTVSATGSPVVVTGTIKQTDTGATVATFTTDAAGNGTITYSNGTTAQIVAWHVLG